MNDGLHVVHVRIVDAATGQPTPVRVRFEGKNGRRFAPLGRLHQFPTGIGHQVGLHLVIDERTFHYVDGSCEILLPAEAFEIEILKGPDYEPIRRTVTLGPGKMALRFVIERRKVSWPAGWYAGDCRVHELSPHAAILEGAAEGLAVVNLLARQRSCVFADGVHDLSQLEAFSGQAACLGAADCSVYVNTFNVHPVLGRLALLNCHRPVYPLLAGETGFEDWTLGDWCGQCHRKKGLAIWSEPTFWSDSFSKAIAPEGLAQVLLGNIDAIEVAGPIEQLGPDSWENWYALLNAGVRIPLAGASGKESNSEHIGRSRTYACIEPETAFSYSAWIEAVRAGRTVVSAGPFIDLKVDGQGPGTEIQPQAGDAKLMVRAESQVGEHPATLELIGNGAVRASSAPDASGLLEIEAVLPSRGLHWLAARLRTTDGRTLGHTSPVYVGHSGGDKSLATSGDWLNPIREALTRGIEWSENLSSFRIQRNKDNLIQTFKHARSVLG